MMLLMQGNTVRQIAFKCGGIKTATVRVHVHNACKKLNARTAIQCAVMIARNEWARQHRSTTEYQ